MKRTFKTFAIAGLMGTLSAPAFAAAHLDVNSMKCDEYNQLGGADRDAVAMMAVMELNDSAVVGDGTATATTAADMSPAAESESSTSMEGSATATSIADAGNDATRMAEEIAVLNRVCSRNWDAMVTEAAAGLHGTR